VADENPPPAAPPFDTEWPPENPGSAPNRASKWTKWFVGIGIFVIVVLIAGTVIRVPYTTLAPGGALDLAPRVSVTGTKSYSDRSDLMMLFVQERAHINLWSLLQAKLDPDIDLVKQSNIIGDNTQQEADLQDVCDMSQSQDSARVAALTALGYKVPVEPGLEVVGLPHTVTTRGAKGAPVQHPVFAHTVLRPCDQLVSADGHKLTHENDLSKIIKAQRPGTEVALSVVRGGKPLTVQAKVVGINGTSIIGVDLAPRFNVPLHVNIDTSDISGPSAGLAITLAIIDALTPGQLTGGKKVAVTGTIDPQGNVGEIGGLPQKALAAKHAGAQIFIVPRCTKGDTGCLADVATARKRVGKDVEVAPVSTLDQALKVLRDAGGAAIPTRAAA
jgi:PDZ domain-containing protein